MSAASELFDRIIARHQQAQREAEQAEQLARQCQALVEIDFLRRFSEHIDGDYATVEQCLDQLGPNVLHLVNSRMGRLTLAHALVGHDAPPFLQPLH